MTGPNSIIFRLTKDLRTLQDKTSWGVAPPLLGVFPYDFAHAIARLEKVEQTSSPFCSFVCRQHNATTKKN